VTPKENRVRATKEEWARLTKEERSKFVQMEWAMSRPTTDYYPDDYGVCIWCGCPTQDGGFCKCCQEEFDELEKKLKGGSLCS